MSEESKSPQKKKRKVYPYPRNSLLECILLIEKIRYSGSNTINRITLANVLELKPNSTEFRTLIPSANKYELIIGGYQAKNIEISPLGQEILDAKQPNKKNELMLKALFKPPLFEKIIRNYDQKIIPESPKLFENVLHTEYNVKKEDAFDFHLILMKNINELELFIEDVSGKKRISIDNFSVDYQKIEKKLETEQDEIIEAIPVVKDVKDTEPIPEFEQIPAEAISKKDPWKPVVFISYSKNPKILEQIEKTLDIVRKIRQTDIECIIAEDEETPAKPLSDRIFDLMKKCNCAIINVSADDENKNVVLIEDKDGNKIEQETYEINGNVLIEIGGAYIRYDRRIILLVDKRMKSKIPTIIKGDYRCEYEGDELSAEVTFKLIEAMAHFFEPEGNI